MNARTSLAIEILLLSSLLRSPGLVKVRSFGRSSLYKSGRNCERKKRKKTKNERSNVKRYTGSSIPIRSNQRNSRKRKRVRRIRIKYYERPTTKKRRRLRLLNSTFYHEAKKRILSEFARRTNDLGYIRTTTDTKIRSTTICKRNFWTRTFVARQ